MKKNWLIGLLLLTGVMATAQNTLVPSVSNYHLTWTTINPAFSGFRDAISISSLYRSSMYGDIGPSNAQLNLHSPIGNSKVAMGAVVAFVDGYSTAANALYDSAISPVCDLSEPWVKQY